MLLYKLTFPSGKIYIGQTVKTMETRFNHHRNTARAGSRLPVHCAWRKYGDPVFEVLGQFDSADALNEAEIAAIAEHDCRVPRGYNLSGGGMNSAVHPDTRRKIANAHVGRVHGPEVRARVAAASKAHWNDPGYRAKVLDGVAASFTPERRQMLSEHAKRIHTGKIVSEATREKLRARVISDEQRARMSASAKARKREPMSAETRAKMAARAKAFWADPENKRLRGQQVKAGHAAKSPAERSAAAKRAWDTKRSKDKVA